MPGHGDIYNQGNRIKCPRVPGWTRARNWKRRRWCVECECPFFRAVWCQGPL